MEENKIKYQVLKSTLLNVLGRTGLDLIKGVVRNNIEAGVIEPAMSKVKIIQVNSWTLP